MQRLRGSDCLSPPPRQRAIVQSGGPSTTAAAAVMSSLGARNQDCPLEKLDFGVRYAMPQVAVTQGRLEKGACYARESFGPPHPLQKEKRKQNQSGIICQGLRNGCTIAALGRSYFQTMPRAQTRTVPGDSLIRWCDRATTRTSHPRL